MKTFFIQTLGCKVNQYESEQLATLLRQRGLLQVESIDRADLRVVNSCAVTNEATVKSRQSVRRMTRLPVLNNPAEHSPGATTSATRVLVMGCWSTSRPKEAAAIPGVDGVITHADPIAETVHRYLDRWSESNDAESSPSDRSIIGACSLPLLDARHTNHVRAFLKIQDGCDAHCTYCIIPRLRPNLWSKPIDDAITEAQRLVDAGHREIVLTGIFMGAYGQPTALRRRQSEASQLIRLIDALCTRVNGLKRLRLSSLEPGDFTDDLASCLRSHAQAVPHFHLPLQSGSAGILRKMNRQYSRDDFLQMIDRVRSAFDRPAMTTDIICGFPGETDDDFVETLDVVDAAGFIHIHAFPYSPREQTAAARWGDRKVLPTIAHDRISTLQSRARKHSLTFRKNFEGEIVELLVEQNKSRDEGDLSQHGRCERYFDVRFESEVRLTGEAVSARIDRAETDATFGTLVRGGQ